MEHGRRLQFALAALYLYYGPSWQVHHRLNGRPYTSAPRQATGLTKAFEDRVLIDKADFVLPPGGVGWGGGTGAVRAGYGRETGGASAAAPVRNAGSQISSAAGAAPCAGAVRSRSRQQQCAALGVPRLRKL